MSISFVPSVSGTLAIQVLSAEIAISNFIAQDYLPCLAADHLSDLYSSIFPDSKIASQYACKRTKTKAIIIDAMEPHLRKPIVEIVRSTLFNLL